MAATRRPVVKLIALIGLFAFMLHGHIIDARKEFDVDLKGDGCDKLTDYYIGDDDIANVFHKISYNAIATRDDCYVTLVTDQGRRLEYIIDEARFEECGITIVVLDSKSGSSSDPKNIINCGVKGIPLRGKTNYNVIRIHVTKVDVDTDNFQFSMKIINDRGPNFDFEIDKSRNPEKDALEPGVIVGIAIAGVIIIIALVLLAIYLCIQARKDYKDNGDNAHPESSVYTSGNSHHLFANKQYPKRYGSTEDVRSTTSSQEKTNGAYSNTAYSTDPYEKKSDRSNSIGRSRGKTSFANESFQPDRMDIMHGDRSWDEGDDYEVRIGSFRKSRKDSFKEEKKLKSAMKKRDPPSEIEMSKVNTQPINSILKKNRTKSPNRSQTSSTEGSVDATAMVYGYNRSTVDHPNVKHKPVLERRRSRSGTRSNRSGSSGGHSSHRRSHSADRKAPPKGNNSRMYGDVFIDDRDSRPKSSSRSRARSNSTGRRRERGSESVDSESSATSSRRVNMNPGGKRVHIKGEETDI